MSIGSHSTTSERLLDLMKTGIRGRLAFRFKRERVAFVLLIPIISDQDPAAV